MDLSLLTSISPDPILIVDKNNNIIECSNTEKIFGYTREELLNHPLELLIPKEYHSIHKRYCEDYFKKPVPRAMKSELAKEFKLLAQHKHGQTFPVDVSLTSVKVPEYGLVVICCVRDLSNLFLDTIKLQKVNQ